MSKSKDVIVIGAGAIGCSIAYHLGAGASRHVSPNASPMPCVPRARPGRSCTHAPYWLAFERCVTTPAEALEGLPVETTETVPGVSVADWLFLHEASYNRMAEFAIELAERGGVDIEYCETPSTDLVTAEQLEEAGGSEALLQPFRAGAASRPTGSTATRCASSSHR